MQTEPPSVPVVTFLGEGASNGAAQPGKPRNGDSFAWLLTSATEADAEALAKRVSMIARETVAGFERGFIARVIVSMDAYAQTPAYAESIRRAIECLEYELQRIEH